MYGCVLLHPLQVSVGSQRRRGCLQQRRKHPFESNLRESYIHRVHLNGEYSDRRVRRQQQWSRIHAQLVGTDQIHSWRHRQDCTRKTHSCNIPLLARLSGYSADCWRLHRIQRQCVRRERT